MRTFAVVASLALLAIVVSPVLRAPGDDGFPLSTYPMFAQPRPTLQKLDYAFGETATGARRTLTPGLLGTGEVLQAVTMLQTAVRLGKPGTEPLCAKIAAAIAGDPDYADVTTVRIVTGTHDAVDYLVRGTHGREVERTRCAVPR